MIINPYQYKKVDETYKSERYAFYRNNLIRLDTIEFKHNGKECFIERMSHFGHSHGKYFEIRDFIYSKVNLTTCELVDIKSSVTNGSICGAPKELPNNYIDISGKALFGFQTVPVYDSSKLLNFNFVYKKDLEDNISVTSLVYGFEDWMNFEYSVSVGNLAAFVTYLSLFLPFRCDIIMDNMSGFNVKNIQPIYKDYDTRQILKKVIIKLNKGLKILSESMKRDFEERRIDSSNFIDPLDRIRVYCSIREFDIYIKVISESHNEYNFHFNISDHLRTILTTVGFMGEKYMFDKRFEDLLDCGVETAYASIFDSEGSRQNFVQDRYPMNFEMNYE